MSASEAQEILRSVSRVLRKHSDVDALLQRLLSDKIIDGNELHQICCAPNGAKGKLQALNRILREKPHRVDSFMVTVRQFLDSGNEDFYRAYRNYEQLQCTPVTRPLTVSEGTKRVSPHFTGLSQLESSQFSQESVEVSVCLYLHSWCVQ